VIIAFTTWRHGLQNLATALALMLVRAIMANGRESWGGGGEPHGF
jgi:hypothetical protein